MHRGYIPTSGEKLHPQNLQMMGLLMERIHRLVENVPPVHPIALGGGLKWRTRVISDGGQGGCTGGTSLPAGKSCSYKICT